MPLHPHQHRALCEELTRGGYQGSAESVRAAMLEPCPPVGKSALHRLGTTRFLTAEELAAMPEKHRPAPGRYCLITAEERAAFPTGLPGFPGKLLLEWVEAAMAEQKGGA